MLPPIIHQGAIKLVVFGCALRFERAIDELGDIHPGDASIVIELHGLLCIFDVIGHQFVKLVDRVSDLVSFVKTLRPDPRAAGIADILLAPADLFEIARNLAISLKHVNLETQATATRIVIQNILQRCVGNEPAIPEALAIDLDRRKARRQGAAGHDMLGTNGDFFAVEIGEAAGLHIDGADA